MAQSFAGVPDVITFQTGASDVLTRVDFPNAARRVRMVFTTNAGKIATVGTDGAAIGAAPFWTAAAGAEVSVFVDRDGSEGGRGPASLYVTSATGTTTVTMLCEAG
jgi:hypothetical protein